MNNRVKRNSIKSSELFDFFWEPWTFIISNLLICFRNFSGVISKKKKLKWNKNTENSSEQLQHIQTKSAQKVFGYLIYICSTINICFIWEWSFQRKKNRSSRPEVVWEKGVLQSNFIEIALQHECSPGCVLHIFRTPFPKNTPEWLLLKKFSFFQCILSLRRFSFPIFTLLEK